MENFVELDFITRLYEMVKTDLYTLLVEESEDKLDYRGKPSFIGKRENGGFASFKYSVINPTNLSYIDLLKVCHSTIDVMLKRDIKMWDKADTVEDFYGYSPSVDTTTHFELSLKFKKESK